MFVLNGVFCKVVWLEMHEFKAVHLSDPEPDLLLESSVSLEDSWRAVSVWKMGRLWTFLLTFLLLLDTLQAGVQNDYDDFNDYEGLEYVDYDNEEEQEEPEYDYEEEDTDVGDTTWTVAGAPGTPPQSGPLPQLVSSDCENERCEIGVGWAPPEGKTCLQGYRVGFKQLSVEVPDEEWTWIDKLEGTHSDVTTGKHFFLEEAEGTFHVQMIPNLPYETTYQVAIEVLNPFGSKKGNILEVTTPPG